MPVRTLMSPRQRHFCLSLSQTSFEKRCLYDDFFEKKYFSETSSSSGRQGLEPVVSLDLPLLLAIGHSAAAHNSRFTFFEMTQFRIDLGVSFLSEIEYTHVVVT